MTVTNVTPPVVSGTAQEGHTLSTTDGTWTFSLDYLTYTYQWLRCDAAGANCVDIGGATSANYALVSADVGSRIRSEVTATEHAGATPPPSNTFPIDQLSDFNGVFNAPYMTEISTPYGAGFNVSCPPAAAAPWDTNMKAVLGKQARTGFLGQTDVWTVYLMYPSAGNPNGFPIAWSSCAWFELHTNTDSGFHWGVDTGWASPGNHFRFGYLLPGLNHLYDYYYSSFTIAFNTWYKMETTITYSTSGSGNVIAKIGLAGGALETLVSRAGRTVDDSIALQLGWYSVGSGGGGNFPNQVQFGGVQRVTT